MTLILLKPMNKLVILIKSHGYLTIPLHKYFSEMKHSFCSLLFFLNIICFLDASFLAITKDMSGKLFLLVEGGLNGLSLPYIHTFLPDGNAAKDEIVSILVKNAFFNILGTVELPGDEDKFEAAQIIAPSNTDSGKKIYVIHLTERLLSSETVQNSLSQKKPSYIKEEVFFRKWVCISDLILAMTLEHTTGSVIGDFTFLSHDDIYFHRERMQLDPEFADYLSNSDIGLALTGAKVENKNIKIIPLNLKGNRNVVGMLPLRIFNSQFYVLMELVDIVNPSQIAPIKTITNITKFNSFNEFFNRVVKVFHSQTLIKFPKSDDNDAEPPFLNRYQRLIVLSRLNARNEYENFLVERIDYHFIMSAKRISESTPGTNFIWVNLEDLTGQLSTNVVNVSQITARTLGSNSSANSGDNYNQEYVETKHLSIGYDLADLLSLPRNLEIIKTRLIPTRTFVVKKSLTNNTLIMAGLASIIAFAIPIIYKKLFYTKMNN